MSEITERQYWINYRDGLEIMSVTGKKSIFNKFEHEETKEVGHLEHIAIRDEIDRVSIVIDFLTSISKNNGFNINQLTVQG